MNAYHKKFPEFVIFHSGTDSSDEPVQDNNATLKKPWKILTKLIMWYWINPHNHRYYLADMVQDLLGDWTLLCAWGGHGTLRGNHSITGVSSYADGLQKIDALGAHREKRGYIAVSSFTAWTSQIAAMEKEAYAPPEKLLQSGDTLAAAFVLK